MAVPNIHATLHSRHRSRSRPERERIAAEYEPDARDIFAARHLIHEGTAHIVISRHRRGRQEKQRRWTERFTDALRGVSSSAWLASHSLSSLADRVRAIVDTRKEV